MRWVLQAEGHGAWGSGNLKKVLRLGCRVRGMARRKLELGLVPVQEPCLPTHMSEMEEVVDMGLITVFPVLSIPAPSPELALMSWCL